MKSTREWVAATVLMMGAATVGAQDSSAIRLAFNIPAQPLDAALTDFAQATGLQLLVLSEIAHERAAPDISGSLTPEAALRVLLEGSGLSYHFVNERTVAISFSEAGMVVPTGSKAHSEFSNPVGNDVLRLAQSTPSSTSTEMSERTDPIADGRTSAAIPQILVKGSRVLNMDVERSRDGAQPYVIFDKEAIQQAGAQDLQEFLRTKLTSNAFSSTPAQSQTGSNRSVINLRGLGTDQTLILVDGHRVASANSSGIAGQPDINGIPLSSIERIEILPTTSSGSYGGSATGGVVNIILRRDYAGLETKLTYGNTFDGGGTNRRVDFSAGSNFAGGKTNLLFTGSYSDANPVLSGDRDFIYEGRQQVLANNRATIYGAATPPLGYTTNIRSTTGANLTLKPGYGGTALGSPVTSVPVGYDGVGSDNAAALVANAGSYNLDLANTAQGGAGARRALYNNPTVKSFRASIRQEFTSTVQAFLDLSRFENEGQFVTNNVPGSFVVPSTAASNPFNQNVRVVTPTFGADGRARSQSEDTRAVGGVIVSLSDNWKAEMDYTWDKNRFASSSPPSTLTTAAGPAVNSGALNLFRDTNEFPVDFSQYLGFQPTVSPAHTEMRDLSLRLAGTLPWSLPGGAATAVAMLERRKDSLDDYMSTSSALFGSLSYGRSQTVESAYFETGLPLVGSGNDRPGLKGLDLTLSARRDDYKSVGANTVSFVPGSPPTDPPVRSENDATSTDYTVAMKYEPFKGLALRASYGTGFRPPSLDQLVALPTDVLDVGQFGLTDPKRGNEPLGIVTVLSGGNPDLRPEESKSKSIGLILQPTFAPGLRLSIDWVRIDKKDNITVFGLENSTLANEDRLPGIIVRGPASDGFAVGPIVEFRGQSLNALGQRVEAYDLSLDYRFENLLGGSLTFGSSATRAKTNEQELVPGIDGINSIGTNGALRWVGNASARYDLRNWSATWATRYYDGYAVRTDRTFLPDLGSSSIPSQTYHDVSVRYHLDGNAPLSVLANSEVQLSVVNVFNKEPPFTGSYPYYSQTGDPRLATYYLSIRKSFF